MTGGRGESLSHLGPSGGLRLEDDGAGRGPDDHAVLTAVDGQHPLIRRPGDVEEPAGVGREPQCPFVGDGDGHMSLPAQLRHRFARAEGNAGPVPAGLLKSMHLLVGVGENQKGEQLVASDVFLHSEPHVPPLPQA